MTETTFDIVEPLIEAYTAENVLRFYEIGTCDNIGWKRVFRRLLKLPTPSPDMQRAFEQLWMEHKYMAPAVGDHRLVVAVARKLLTPYCGPAVRLFRGTHRQERQWHQYGLSWTADRVAAERFAEPIHGSDGVVLETLALPPAIIHQMNYPKPITDQERAGILRECPDAHFDEYHDEREYLVDRKFLTAVIAVSDGLSPAGCPDCGVEGG